MQKVKISIHSNILIPADKKTLQKEGFFLQFNLLVEKNYLTRSLYSPATSIPAEYPISSRIVF